MHARIVIPLAAIALLAAPTAASAAFPHVVAPGESLASVAAADGLTIDQLAAANGLASDGQLIAGSTLQIPPQTSAPTSSGTAPASVTTASRDTPASGSYLVQPGDTLSAIAARAGTSVAQLASANGLDPNGTLLAGRALQLSAAGSSGASSSAASSQPIGAAAEGSSSGAPYPTPETVSPNQVGSIAAANGVSPSLAEAIGYQESGFNNNLVSSADARGVMQILPGTWDWITQTLAGPTQLAPASATSNILGGVLMLHSLLSATGGDPALAAAGYYQGLPSVRQHGMYPSTQQYVGNVLSLMKRFGGG
jgi:LysM repeat protein